MDEKLADEIEAFKQDRLLDLFTLPVLRVSEAEAIIDLIWSTVTTCRGADLVKRTIVHQRECLKAADGARCNEGADGAQDKTGDGQ